MRVLTIVFLVFLVIFLGIQLLLQVGATFPSWIQSYAGDFLCMPIVLSICLFAVQYIKRNRSIRLSLLSIFSLTVLYAIYFEVVLPQIHPRYTADFIDVILYFCGAGLFYFLQNLEGNYTP